MALTDILKTFKKQGKDDSRLLPKLERYLIALDGKEMKGKENNRAKDCFHPSNLSTTACVRSIVYGWLKTEPSNPQKVNAKGRRIFDVGHHAGYMMQQYFWDMGILEGLWHCISCKHDFWAVSPKECPHCKSELEIWYNLHYKEVPIYNADKNIIGHADGMVVLEDGKRRLLEFKTIKNRDFATREGSITFDDLIQPKEEHAFQCQLYMDSDTIKQLNCSQASIFYLAKNTQEIKEFTITGMPELVKPMYDRIDAVNHALGNGYLPDRIKDDPKSFECKYCPFNGYCHTEHSFKDADMRAVEK